MKQEKPKFMSQHSVAISSHVVPSWAMAHFLYMPCVGAETFEKMFVATAVTAVSVKNVIVLRVPLVHAPVNLAVETPPAPPGALGRVLAFRGRLPVS